MNTVISIVRTILPISRPAATAAAATRRGAAAESDGVRGASAGTEERPAGTRGTGLPQREPSVDEHAVDLAALLPRQAGPGRAWEPPSRGVDDGGRERRPAVDGSGELANDRVAAGAAEPDAAGADSVNAAGDDSNGANSDTATDTDAGMSTAEYAIGTVAAAALAAVLYMIVTGDSVTSALTSIIEQALSVDF